LFFYLYILVDCKTWEVVSGTGNAPVALFCGRGRKTENFRWLSAIFPPHRQKMANGAIHRLEPVSLQPFIFELNFAKIRLFGEVA